MSFINAMRTVAHNSGARIYAYCLMGNHFHIAIKIADQPLGRLMQRILTSYSVTFNKKHSRRGHLFQARFKSIVCRDDAYLISLIRYIHLNPVRAGLTKSPAEWPWSSWREYAESGGDGSMPFLGALERLLSSDPPLEFSPWLEATDPEHAPAPKVDAPSITLGQLADQAASRFNLTPGEIISPSAGRLIVNARRAFASEAFKAGHTTRDISAFLGCTPSAVSRYTRRRTVNSARTDTPIVA